MESPDHAVYGPSSPDAGSKRSHRPRSPPPAADDKEKHTHLRFLVSNIAAGSIIGKGGSTITEFQAESGARIQLSRSNELFPGTADRILMISGTFTEIYRAMEMVLDKLLNEVEEGNEADVRLKTRLVVPNSSCGAIIGKGGATIKTFIEESQAGIKISPQDQTMIGLNDRLVTVTGSLEEQLSAIDMILVKLSEDAYYPQTLNSPFPYAAIGVGSPAGYMVPSLLSYGPNGVGARSSMNKGMVSPGPSTRSPTAPNGARTSSVTIGVGDEHIGAVVGRAGRNIMEISQVSGARIKISDRGDFMPGTSDRKVTITGAPEAIRTAEAMVMQKVAANSER